MTGTSHKLILFVSGMSVKSSHAIENLKAICDEHLKERVNLEIIDIGRQKEKATEYGIFAIPTLIKLEPAPKRIIIGDLSDTANVLKSLDILPWKK